MEEQVYVILYGKEMEEICRNVFLSFKNTLGIWYIYIYIYADIYPKYVIYMYIYIYSK